MGIANGLNHLAINTKDIKTQIKFFTEVVGAELCALYWMHGATKTFHGFLRFSDTCSFAFVQSPHTVNSKAEPGEAAVDEPGAMQHVALNVDTEPDLLAIRDRVRSTGHSIVGPIDHGFCNPSTWPRPRASRSSSVPPMGAALMKRRGLIQR